MTHEPNALKNPLCPSCESGWALNDESDAYQWLKEHSYKHLAQDGGGKGGTEYCYTVFELDGKIYKGEYSYYSYHGHNFDELLDSIHEVKPVQKTVTVYE